jgi:hypothetical protein
MIREKQLLQSISSSPLIWTFHLLLYSYFISRRFQVNKLHSLEYYGG